MTPDEFKQILRERNADEIVVKHITSADPGPYVSADALAYVDAKARLMFQIKETELFKPIVVGSAKLGFSLVEKRGEDWYKPRYRTYQPGVSDIDVAFVSAALFGKIWMDLALYGARQRSFPWRSTDLGVYMVHGWIRPDKFPTPHPQRCADLYALMRDLDTSKHFRFLKLRCAVYHSMYFLNLYQQRSVIDAQNAEM
jgi:hypothetical protein